MFYMIDKVDWQVRIKKDDVIVNTKATMSWLSAWKQTSKIVAPISCRVAENSPLLYMVVLLNYDI